MLNLHKHFLLGAIIAIASVPTATAQSLTTLYAANNGGSVGGAVYFDVTILSPVGVWITAFDTNVGETVPMTLDVYTTPTTAVGNQTNAAAWTKVATGKGIGQGQNNPTSVDTSDFFLRPGPHGIALVLTSAGHDYTNGNGANQMYANAELQIDLGSATNQPFVGGVFNPRVWNGEIYYSAKGNNVSTYGTYGDGCLGTNGLAPALTATLPKVGNSYTVTVSNLAPAAPLAYITIGFSKSQWAGGPLPLALAFVGAPGCELLADPLMAIPGPNTLGTASQVFAIPNLPVLLFARVYNQSLVLDQNANAFGFVFSNGGEGTIGN